MRGRQQVTIAVFGLGYVGCVSAACLAQMGHLVIGVDTDPAKAEKINRGQATIVEAGISELVAEQVQAGRLRADTDAGRVIAQTDAAIICVGTPSAGNGSPDLSFIWQVAGQFRDAMPGKTRFYPIILRSTVPPGTCRAFEQVVEQSGKQANRDFAVISNPEFLREGSSIEDYFHPAYTLIGAEDQAVRQVLEPIYSGLDAPLAETDRETAEMVKYVSNAYHALKVVFANEVGAICKAYGIDSHRVMELFCRDRRLNLSSAYLKPGFAFGGSCLPKDLRALNAMAREREVEVSLLPAVECSNELQIDRAFGMIASSGMRRIGVLGMAFKAGTDDLRESPVVKLLERLLGKGYEVMVHDPYVYASRQRAEESHGSLAVLPHLVSRLVPDLADISAFADVIVIAQRSLEYAEFIEQTLSNKTIIDLVRFADSVPDSSRYNGLAW